MEISFSSLGTFPVLVFIVLPAVSCQAFYINFFFVFFSREVG